MDSNESPFNIIKHPKSCRKGESCRGRRENSETQESIGVAIMTIKQLILSLGMTRWAGFLN